jgi:hypothetical protein
MCKENTETEKATNEMHDKHHGKNTNSISEQNSVRERNTVADFTESFHLLFRIFPSWENLNNGENAKNSRLLHV